MVRSAEDARLNALWAVVPAGGIGSRMQVSIPKQYLQLGGRTIIEHTLARLCACEAVTRIVVGIAAEDTHWHALGFRHAKLTATVAAGAERAETVANCLAYIEQQGGGNDWVLVHDAARPCVRIEDVNLLIEQVTEQAEGGILALPLSDTIKRADRDEPDFIQQSVPRDYLWRAMTPQLFRVGQLLTAIRATIEQGIEVTDEASSMEATGCRVRLVACSPDNIKITLPQDIRFAELILAAQREETR